MEKIPVGATISHAYKYIFKNFLTILGIMWLPFALIAASAALIGMASGEFGRAVATSNATELAHVWYLVAPFYAVTFFLVTMQIEGLTRHALGLRPGPVYFHFSFDRPVWRLLGAYLLFILLMIAIVVLFVGGGVLIGMTVAALTGVTPGKPPTAGATAGMGIVVVVIGLVAYCAFIYWILRQSFLLTPIVVAEERIGLGRAWKLGRGNFWRILIIGIAILGPIALIEVVAIFKFLMPGMPPTAAQGATPDQIAAWNAAYFEHIRSYWYILLPIYFLIATVMYGLLCSAQAFAYRSLVPAEKAEDVF